LGKSLLRFPDKEGPLANMLDTETWHHLAMHFTGLTGNDKAPKAARIVEFDRLTELAGIRGMEDADSPLTLKAHLELFKRGRWNSIPIQLDGTCNGLQHLSALMRDEVGAAQVNLTQGGDRPSDIYGSVASTAEETLVGAVLMARGTDNMAWWLRLRAAGILLNRSLCKGPVMVLPYGGTFDAIRQSVKASVLGQLGVTSEDSIYSSPWHDVRDDGYAAFKTRRLEDHPLFNEDIRLLAKLIHSCITPAIPKAMACMGTLQEIGKWVGTRALAWQTGPCAAAAEDTLPEHPAANTAGNLWVIQAKSKSARKQVKMRGYHLPEVIQRLTIVTQTDEVDNRAHRTGIVANFIHSMDAEHLMRTVRRFKDLGGSCVGTIHDCVMCRPSEVSLMHRALRETFAEMYSDAQHPLMRPVRLIHTEGVDEGRVEEYASWHELATAAGTSFPAPGEWKPTEVLDSQWFFS